LDVGVLLFLGVVVSFFLGVGVAFLDVGVAFLGVAVLLFFWCARGNICT
jgi:hypothetical protein